MSDDSTQNDVETIKRTTFNRYYIQQLNDNMFSGFLQFFLNFITVARLIISTTYANRLKTHISLILRVSKFMTKNSRLEIATFL